MNRTPCAANPQAWDTYRETGDHRRKATRHELQTAITGCHRCPQFMACITLDPPMDMVQAAVIYTGEGNPIEIGRFLNEPSPLVACGDMKGRREGWERHEAAGEEPCTLCRQRKNERAREPHLRRVRKKPAKCTRGHLFPAVPLLDSCGRRVCPGCKPHIYEMFGRGDENAQAVA